MSTDTSRPFAVVTGASTGIGLELAKQFATGGYDLLVAAEDERVEGVPAQLLEVEPRAVVHAARVDLATAAGVEQLWARATEGGRAVDAVALHAGVG
ncbi:SDR family NAD(P)-dependent oxidoreductase, partial [Kineococcus indalonis]|uniref:SDR family NAD(P)-dependent oxidoreductase n=1 Tax=Kineococcus indalonis TaxID=2696566 RepID=UPI0014133703